MSRLAEIGIIGLGVMGRNLALNFSDHGRNVAVYDPFPEAVAAFDPEGADIRICKDLDAFVKALKPPRAKMSMPNASLLLFPASSTPHPPPLATGKPLPVCARISSVGAMILAMSRENL